MANHYRIYTTESTRELTFKEHFYATNADNILNK